MREATAPEARREQIRSSPDTVASSFANVKRDHCIGDASLHERIPELTTTHRAARCLREELSQRRHGVIVPRTCGQVFLATDSCAKIIVTNGIS